MVLALCLILTLLTVICVGMVFNATTKEQKTIAAVGIGGAFILIALLSYGAGDIGFSEFNWRVHLSHLETAGLITSVDTSYVMGLSVEEYDKLNEDAKKYVDFVRKAQAEVRNQ